MTLHKYPFNEENDLIQVVPPISNANEMDIETDGIDISLSSRDKGTKKIGTLGPRYGGPHLPEVLGYIQSPFEKRIVVVVGYFNRGWEREKLTQAKIEIFGASLISGFKK